MRRQQNKREIKHLYLGWLIRHFSIDINNRSIVLWLFSKVGQKISVGESLFEEGDKRNKMFIWSWVMCFDIYHTKYVLDLVIVPDDVSHCNSVVYTFWLQLMLTFWVRAPLMTKIQGCSWSNYLHFCVPNKSGPCDHIANWHTPSSQDILDTTAEKSKYIVVSLNNCGLWCSGAAWSLTLAWLLILLAVAKDKWGKVVSMNNEWEKWNWIPCSVHLTIMFGFKGCSST